MSDSTVPIILAVVSLAGTLITTVVTAYITYFSEEHKARREADKILLKYRDPLLLAATDLQARCFGICDFGLLDFMDMDKEGEDMYKDTLYIYTAYVVGQYLSWTWILRRQAQFVALVSSSAPKWRLLDRKNENSASSLMDKIESVKAAFNADKDYMAQEKSFLLFKANQQLIGEIMSCQDAKGEYYCMGFATFTERWKNGDPGNTNEHGEHKGDAVDHDKDHIGERMAGVNKISDRAFRAHFKQIEDGITYMYRKRMLWKEMHPNEKPSNQGSDGRLRRLQHLLIDLMAHLDPKHQMSNQKESSLARAAHRCECSAGPCHCKRDCKKCMRNNKAFFARKAHAAADCACDQCPHTKPQPSKTGHGPVHTVPRHGTSKDAVAGAISVASSHEKNGAHA